MLLTLAILFVSRVFNIVPCSVLLNITRKENTVTCKKQFFLWFAGVRGAMAYAIAVKSKKEYPEYGGLFTLLTLIETAVTLIYGSFLLECTMKLCGVVQEGEAHHHEEDSIQLTPYTEGLEYTQLDCFGKLKYNLSKFSETKFQKYVEREPGEVHNPEEDHLPHPIHPPLPLNDSIDKHNDRPLVTDERNLLNSERKKSDLGIKNTASEKIMRNIDNSGNLDIAKKSHSEWIGAIKKPINDSSVDHEVMDKNQLNYEHITLENKNNNNEN